MLLISVMLVFKEMSLEQAINIIEYKEMNKLQPASWIDVGKCQVKVNGKKTNLSLGGCRHAAVTQGIA